MKEETAMMSARRCCSGSCEPLLSLLFVPLEDSRLRKTLNGKQHGREDPWTRNSEYTSFIHYVLSFVFWPEESSIRGSGNHTVMRRTVNLMALCCAGVTSRDLDARALAEIVMITLKITRSKEVTPFLIIIIQEVCRKACVIKKKEHLVNACTLGWCRYCYN